MINFFLPFFPDGDLPEAELVPGRKLLSSPETWREVLNHPPRGVIGIRYSPRNA